MIEQAEEIRALVREKYGAIARQQNGCCGSSCGCEGGAEGIDMIGRAYQSVEGYVAEADLGLGCGVPTEHAGIMPGDTVLDLGAGAGIDAFLASREVGPQGRVIGVDMTPDMIARAQANAREGDFANTEFRLGEIERLPVADDCVDVIISNCVINLSPEKEAVFREAFRVLKPGGRILVSDLVWLSPPPDEVRGSVEALIGCVAGASLKDDYLALMRAAGFAEVTVVAQHGYGADACCGTTGAEAVASVKVRGVKPAVS